MANRPEGCQFTLSNMPLKSSVAFMTGWTGWNTAFSLTMHTRGNKRFSNEYTTVKTVLISKIIDTEPRPRSNRLKCDEYANAALLVHFSSTKTESPSRLTLRSLHKNDTWTTFLNQNRERGVSVGTICGSTIPSFPGSYLSVVSKSSCFATIRWPFRCWYTTVFLRLPQITRIYDENSYGT